MDSAQPAGQTLGQKAGLGVLLHKKDEDLFDSGRESSVKVRRLIVGTLCLWV